MGNASPMFAILLLFLVVLLPTSEAYFRGPGERIQAAVIIRTGNPRPMIYLFQGPNEHLLITRLVFSTPPPLVPPGESSASIMRHPSLVAQAGDLAVLDLVTDAPTGLMRRTAVSSHMQVHYLQVEAVQDPSHYAPGWNAMSEWRAALYLDPASSLWNHFRCYHMGTQPHSMIEISRDRDYCHLHAHDQADASWSVTPYDYSMPRDFSVDEGHVRHHQTRYGALLLGYARIVEPFLNESQKAAIVDCIEEVCEQGEREPIYPIVIDLESPRNYMPMELFYLTPVPVRIVLEFGEHSVTIDWASHRSMFTANYDSQEIVLGLEFLRGNYSHLTYDAEQATVGVKWHVQGPPMFLRIVVSVLVCFQIYLVLRWMDSRNFSSMKRIMEAAAALAPTQRATAFKIPFDAKQIFYEIVALAVVLVVFCFVVPFVRPIIAEFFVIASIGCGIHIILSILVVWWTWQTTTKKVILGIIRGKFSLEEGGPNNNTTIYPQSVRTVLTRNFLHMYSMGMSILLGLCLSSDSIVVMLGAIFLGLLLIYHLTYCIGTMLVADLAFSWSSTTWGSRAWKGYVLFECVTYISVLFTLHKFLNVAVLVSINSFYPVYLIDFLVVVLEAGAALFGFYNVFAEATAFVTHEKDM